MNGNSELLNFIYQNSQMGVDTIEQLLDIATDNDFKEHLNAELEKYNRLNDDAKQLLNDNGYDEKGISAFEKIRTYLMINMQTMHDKTASHIAEMMIIGSNMGVVDAIKNLRKYSNAEKNIIQLMKELQKFEENNVESLKRFL